MSGTYNRKDSFYNQAKSAGLRSRAYYKLEELDTKYQILKPTSRVLDLGAWPGGWLQYVTKRIQPAGSAIGIDLVEIEPLPNVDTLVGDIRDAEVIQQATEMAGGNFNVLLSDLSPKLSGIREADQAASTGLAEAVLWVASQVLELEGSVVIKLFKGGASDSFVQDARGYFRKVVRAELKSTRKTSNEFYFLGFKWQG